MAAPLKVINFSHPSKTKSKQQDPRLPDLPVRMLFIGPPSCGKRSNLLTMIFQIETNGLPFDTITVLHLDSRTIEYNVLKGDNVEYHVYNPQSVKDGELSFENFDGKKQNCLVIDEIDFKQLGDKAVSSIERLLGYASSHKNVSIFMCYQQLTKIPPQIRRLMNEYVVFKQDTPEVVDMIAIRTGAPKEHLKELLMGMTKTKHDSIRIRCDQPPDTSLRYMLNLFQPIHHKRKK